MSKLDLSSLRFNTDKLVEKVREKLESLLDFDERVQCAIDVIENVRHPDDYNQANVRAVLNCIHELSYADQVAIFLKEGESRWSQAELISMANPNTQIFLLHLSLSDSNQLDYQALRSQFSGYFRGDDHKELAEFITKFDELHHFSDSIRDKLQKRQDVAKEVAEHIRTRCDDGVTKEVLELPSRFLSAQDQLVVLQNCWNSPEDDSSIHVSLKKVLDDLNQVVDREVIVADGPIFEKVAPSLVRELSKDQTDSEFLFALSSFTGARVPGLLDYMSAEKLNTLITYAAKQLCELRRTANSGKEAELFRRAQHQLPDHIQYLIDGVTAVLADDWGVLQVESPYDYVMSEAPKLSAGISADLQNVFNHYHTLIQLDFAAKNWLKLNSDSNSELVILVADLAVRLAAFLAASMKGNDNAVAAMERLSELEEVLSRLTGVEGLGKDLDNALRSACDSPSLSVVAKFESSNAPQDSQTVSQLVEAIKLNYAIKQVIANNTDRDVRKRLEAEIRGKSRQGNLRDDHKWTNRIAKYLRSIETMYGAWSAKESTVAQLYRDYFYTLLQDELAQPGNTNYWRMKALTDQPFFKGDKSDADLSLTAINYLSEVSVRVTDSCPNDRLLPSDSALFRLFRYQIMRLVLDKKEIKLWPIKDFYKKYVSADTRQALERFEKVLRLYQAIKSHKERFYDKPGHSEHCFGSAKWTISSALVRFFENAFGLGDNPSYDIDNHWEEKLSVIMSLFQPGSRIRYQAVEGSTSKLYPWLKELGGCMDKIGLQPTRSMTESFVRLELFGLPSDSQFVGYRSYLLQYAVKSFPHTAYNFADSECHRKVFELMLCGSAASDGGLLRDMMSLVSDPAVYFSRKFKEGSGSIRSIFEVLCIKKSSFLFDLFKAVEAKVNKKPGWANSNFSAIADEFFNILLRSSRSRSRRLEVALMPALSELGWKRRAFILMASKSNKYLIELENVYKEIPFSYFIDCLRFAVASKNTALVDVVSRVWRRAVAHYQSTKAGKSRMMEADQSKERTQSIFFADLVAKALIKLNAALFPLDTALRALSKDVDIQCSRSKKLKSIRGFGINLDECLGRVKARSEQLVARREGLLAENKGKLQERSRLQYFLKSAGAERGVPVIASLRLLNSGLPDIAHEFTANRLLKSPLFLHNFATMDAEKFPLNACVRLMEGLPRATAVKEEAVKPYFVAMINKRSSRHEKVFLGRLYLLAAAKHDLSIYSVGSSQEKLHQEKKKAASQLLSILNNFFKNFDAPSEVTDMRVFAQVRIKINRALTSLKTQGSWGLVVQGSSSRLGKVLGWLRQVSDKQNLGRMPAGTRASILRKVSSSDLQQYLSRHTPGKY